MKSLLKASHFGPTVIVVSATYILALSQYPVSSALQIAAAIFAGQLVVGWSNDLWDYELDKTAGRLKKPLVSGELKEETLRLSIPVALFLSHEATPPLWLVLGFILVSVAFHFLNVLKDLSWDIAQGVMGAPQRVGRNSSAVIALALVLTALMQFLYLR
jgi:4-hydroxybenzoate polyprenyltransferase